ncbi:MAG: toll/interleukin-1 receptor domain-containing protein [Hyphomonadaceae bacterium]
MTQSVVLHTYRAKEYAESVVCGLQHEGYAVPWDPQAGGMIVTGALAPESAPCVIVLWTKDAIIQKWVLEYARAAYQRGALIEVLIDPVVSPFNQSLAPIDFTHGWDGRPKGPLWKAFMDRVRAKSGRPIGRLPFKEQFQPVMAVWVMGFVTVATLATGGPLLRPSGDELAAREPIAADPQPAVETAMGGPAASAQILAPADAARAPQVTVEPEERYMVRSTVKLRYEPISAPAPREVQDGAMITFVGHGDAG